MEYAKQTIEDFLAVTAGKDPVPGGGSISALCGALASALGEMVTGLTIGRKKYVDVQTIMEQLAPDFAAAREFFINAIAEDAAAYDKVFNAYKLPKETDEDKEKRTEAIQEAMIIAAKVPLEVADRAVALMSSLAEIAEKGNQNAITDACVATMCARTAALGAILNCRINLSSLNDADTAQLLSARCDQLQQEACRCEQSILAAAKI